MSQSAHEKCKQAIDSACVGGALRVVGCHSRKGREDHQVPSLCLATGLKMIMISLIVGVRAALHAIAVVADRTRTLPLVSSITSVQFGLVGSSVHTSQ